MKKEHRARHSASPEAPPRRVAPAKSSVKACPPESAAACLVAPASLSDNEDDLDLNVAMLAKALGHPIRVKILRLLLARGECVCGEIVGELPLAQATVSQHLKVLKDAGLIAGEIQAPRTCYCASPGRLKQFKALLSRL